MSDFFDYCCDQCGRPFCERIHVMNLALNRLEEEFCLECLSECEGMALRPFYDWILNYIDARDCFKAPWHQFDAMACPRITDHSCFCELTSS